MTNEETLKLLKPIMLDGSEKEGDKLYHIRWGWVTVGGTTVGREYPIWVTHANSPHSFTADGFCLKTDALPSLFKRNPYEWLAQQNQGRVIEVNSSGKWIRRVLIKVVNGKAKCWNSATTISEADTESSTSTWKEWRELPTKITKEEALKMLAEKGVDITNLIIE
jgi:hypothetical protein